MPARATAGRSTRPALPCGPLRSPRGWRLRRRRRVHRQQGIRLRGGAMRAAVAEGEGKLVVREFDDPGEPGPGEIRVAVRAAGVCHTDVGVVEGYLMQGPPPVIPGHEPMGVVDALGEGV